MATKKPTQAEIDAAKVKLANRLNDGRNKLYFILRSVSRSNATHRFSVFTIVDNEIVYLERLVQTVCGIFGRDGELVTVSGTGFNHLGSVVNHVQRALYPDDPTRRINGYLV